MYTFLIANNIYHAWILAPWSKKTIPYSNGFLVFATLETYEQWKNGMINDPRQPYNLTESDK